MDNKLSFEQFKKYINPLVKHYSGTDEFLYDVYDMAVESIEELNHTSVMPSNLMINHFELIFYILGEYIYSVSPRNDEQIEAFHKNDDFKSSMASVSADKYVSGSAFNYQERKLGNKYFPPISSLNLYLNFILNIVKNYKKSDPATSLIADLLMKSVSYASSISLLLVNGFETQAFATWRTLHECECVLTILEKYEKECLPTYLKHMSYGVLFRKGHSDNEKEQALFDELKEEMRERNLKSKDMKKFIEYGWLYQVPGVKEDETFKLNFRDGLEKVAKLEMYKDRYDVSSEIVHSTPLLIYSSKDYYYFLTLLSLYESFFKLESFFVNLFTPNVNKEQLDAYNRLKGVYYTQLINIYKSEVKRFNKWQERVLQQKQN